MRVLVRAIGWVIVGSFAITFVVTILSLIHKLPIEEPYRKGLFTTLIVELISASFFLFYKGFNEESSSRALEGLKGIVAKQDGIKPEQVNLESIQRRLSAPPPCADCSKDYTATVYWHNDYAERLFNFQGLTPNFQPVNPRSEGNLHYYRTRAGCYKGYSTWTTKNGEQSYSQVVVIHSEFEFVSPGKLKQLCIKIVVRQKLVEFSYGPFTHYRMRFNEWSETGLRGKMLLVQNGNCTEEVEVGEVVMELS